MSLKPICVPCQRFYRMEKSGYYFIEGMPRFAQAPKGTEAPDQWQPYKLWAGDLWRCEGCGAQIVNGTRRNPISEHYQPHFSGDVERLNASQLQVNDC